METDLSSKKCTPCQGGIPPLKGKLIKIFHDRIDKSWKVVKQHHLEKEFIFKDFKEALAFTNKVGELAEKEGHHPDIYLSWGKVKIITYTHKINGLHENDFILAAKIDEIK
jgi:4a-hydroxytetrahydrobiopterin dehydratase